MTAYESELQELQSTLNAALIADLSSLKNAILGASQSSIIGVGSGGSYTVASLLCSLHEAYTGRVSRSVTPLELICNPTLASASPIFIFSAEGKNPDIIEALKRARKHSSRAVHVVTNRAQSKLMDAAASLHDVSTHVFELNKKDGYLATNSLAMDAALVARAFGELDTGSSPDFLRVDEITLGGQPLDDWLKLAGSFAEEAIGRKGLIVIYSPPLRPLVEDLESKLSESSLLFTQLADFRSFAHGRHLWLTERSTDCALLILTEPAAHGLWQDVKQKVPASVPTLTLELAGATPTELIAGLVAVMHFVSKIADAARRNIAKPEVSALGRQLYYADLPSLIPPPDDQEVMGEYSKYEVLGAHWPNPRSSGKIRRALEDAKASIGSQLFRSLVFDYDGTLCSSNAKDMAPPPEILRHLTRIVEGGVIVGIASGRGGSISEHLSAELPSKIAGEIRLGLYNGGWLGRVGEVPPQQQKLSEFLIHAQRVVSNLKTIGVPIETVRINAPHQLSVRFQSGVSTEAMWYVVADAMKQSGLETGTISRSKHSIDILSQGVSKSHLVAEIVQTDRVDPYEVITMGDLGAWPGNDASLLQHRYSLSVDMPSRRLDRGWKLAPKFMRDVDATLWYLDRIELIEGGRFRLRLTED